MNAWFQLMFGSNEHPSQMTIRSIKSTGLRNLMSRMMQKTYGHCIKHINNYTDYLRPMKKPVSTQRSNHITYTIWMVCKWKYFSLKWQDRHKHWNEKVKTKTSELGMAVFTCHKEMKLVTSIT